MHKISVLVLLSIAHSLNSVTKGSYASSKKEMPGAHFHYSSEEIHVLSQGVLKLGAGLKEQVDHTKEKITYICQQLNIFNNSLIELLEQVSLNKRLRNGLMEKTQQLETRNQVLGRLSAELQNQLGEVMHYRMTFNTKLEFLKEKIENALNYKTNTSTSSFVQTQSIRIDELLTEVELQEDQISIQDALIQKLLKKVRPKSKLARQRKTNGIRKKIADFSEMQNTTLSVHESI
ncbi:angiopoietin-related protein 3-like isoform X2 [Gopherus flavomarginatus]|uniref:angiopoietin-related protein 3-like isoform X2 n=1 Tax=Gopherus flavomarginatus TaxID=286002 RepID=UPI0021CBDCC9|nr:angiopoietin-related protein 3-like isoform X2 [Gopherus flavomarginatus]